MYGKLKQEAQSLRSEGKTYSEIQKTLRNKVPKSTLSNWCKEIVLPNEYLLKLKKLNKLNLEKARALALEVNKNSRELYVNSIKKSLVPIATFVKDKRVAKLFLAALYLGEGKKGAKNRQLCLGNSNPHIILIYIELLKYLYKFDIKRVRCTVQCRSDQDISQLENYWSDLTKIPKSSFYKAQVDPRTLGKPTLKKDYKGVLRIDYFDTKIHLELEYLADLVCEYFAVSLGR